MLFRTTERAQYVFRAPGVGPLPGYHEGSIRPSEGAARMSQIEVEYEGDLHCRLHHGPSGAEIQTDAPPDNQGKGGNFSPSDLLAASLGSCVMTVMGIYA